MMFRNVTRLFFLASACVLVAAAQDQPAYVRDLCIKVAPGKGAEYTAFVRDVVAKRMQVRVDEGQAAWWLALSSVVPAGTAAMCDYHLVWGFNGLPPEAATPEQDAVEMTKAGINITVPQYEAMRDSLSSLVNVDIWRMRGDAGSAPEKGQYVRLTYYEVKPGQQATWMYLENTRWKPFIESVKNDGFGWHLHTLSMPVGNYLHYNAMTAETYPTWAAAIQGVPAASTAWSKLHPDMTIADFVRLVGSTRERYREDLLRIAAMTRPK